MIEKVLIADDEPFMRSFLSEALKRSKREVVEAKNGSEAIAFLKENHFDLVISDMKMPLKSGLEVLETAKIVNPRLPVIIMTAYATVENAVEAMKKGAFNYILKPFTIEALEASLEKVEEHLSLIAENQFLKQEYFSKQDIIVKSPSLLGIFKDLEKIAKSKASVFISGESGTGKEVIAQAIHNLSERATKPFIKVNCAAIPDTLIESEFFGHERGAFTGAEARRIGRFELASGGTLLLDEITEIPLNLQPKLLRAIQEEEIERIGSVKPIPVNIRFIATSNRDIKEAIKAEKMREDLFYRLNVVPIFLPPLRERKDDIIPLANHFFKVFTRENHKPPRSITEKDEKKILNYVWPGNVRELANIIERAVVLDTEIQIENNEEKKHLTPSLPIEPLSEMEKKAILSTLNALHNNRAKSAEALGISVRTLQNKLKLYKLEKF